MSIRVSSEAFAYLSSGELQFLRSAISLHEQCSVPTSGHAVSLCLAERSALRIAKWHCPGAWVAAPLVIPLLAKDANACELIGSTVSPDVAQIARRYLDLDAMDIPVPDGRREALQTPFQRLQKLFIASYLDEPVAFLSIADMLGKLEDIEGSLSDDVHAIGQELQVLLLPLLECFGLWQLRRHVSESLFRLIDSAEAEKMSVAIQQYDSRRRRVLDQVECMLLPELQKLDIGARISHHRIRPSRVLELTSSLSAFGSEQDRSERQHEFDTRIALDVTVEDQFQCYVALGAIHKLWRFVPGNFRDSIGSPRFNGYRMIHTAARLTTSHGETYNVKFRIGTSSIREANLWGRVDEWRVGKGDPARLLPTSWWHNADEQRQVLATHQAGQYSSPTYVFSPVGQLYVLPRYSTPVDYAYEVHSELGHFYIGARVNGSDVPHGFPLANADIVDVQFDPYFQSRPRSQWLPHVKTPLAASKIRKQLARRYGRAHRGRQLAEHAVKLQCQQLGITLTDRRVQGYLKQAAKWFNSSDLESFFLRVVDGRISPDAIAVRIMSRELAHRVTYPNDEPLGLRYHCVKIAQCCQPTLDDDIVGRFSQRGTRHERVKIHTSSCPNVPCDSCTVGLAWRPADYQGLYEYLAFGDDREWILLEVLEPFYEQHAYLHKVQAERLEDGSAQFLLLAEPESDQRARELEECLGSIPDIHDCSSRPLAMAPAEVAARKRTLRRRNPFTFDRPVHRKGDFVGRDYELDLIKSYINQDEQGGPIIVYGPWRIGKTSFLRHIGQYDRSDFNSITVFVDCHGIPDLRLETLLKKIAEEVSSRMRRETDMLGAHHLAFGPEDRENLSADPVAGFRQYLRRVSRVLDAESAPRLTIMIDEFSDFYDDVREGKLDGTVFRNLGGLIQGEPEVVFILVVQVAALQEVQCAGGKGAGLLETARLLSLGPLPSESVGDLLARRARVAGLSFEKEAIARVLKLCGGNPYLLNIMCYQMVERLKETGEHAIRVCHLEPAIKEFFHQYGGVYFSHLCELIQNEFEWQIVRALAEIEEEVWASESTISHSISCGAAGGSPVYDIQNILAKLVDNGFLTTHPDAHTLDLYRIQVPLFARWLMARGSALWEGGGHGSG